MGFVPIVDLLIFHSLSGDQPLYQHTSINLHSKGDEHHTGLLFGAIQTLKVLSSRLNDSKGPTDLSALNINGDNNIIYFNPLTSSFKSFKTPVYSLYFFETATGFQILLLVGHQEESSSNIHGPYCRSDILDAGSGEGSQVILQHFYKNVIVDGIILDRKFIGLDFSEHAGKSWTQVAKEDLPNLFGLNLKDKVDRFFSELPKL